MYIQKCLSRSAGREGRTQWKNVTHSLWCIVKVTPAFVILTGGFKCSSIIFLIIQQNRTEDRGLFAITFSQNKKRTKGIFFLWLLFEIYFHKSFFFFAIQVVIWFVGTAAGWGFLLSDTVTSGHSTRRGLSASAIKNLCHLPLRLSCQDKWQHQLLSANAPKQPIFTFKWQSTVVGVENLSLREQSRK